MIDENNLTSNKFSPDEGVNEMFSDEWFETSYRIIFNSSNIRFIVILVLTTLLGLQTFSVNSFVFLFYRQKRNNVVSVSYSLLSICDICMGGVAVLHAVLLFLSIIGTNTNIVKYWATFVFAVSFITIRMSVFFNVLLAILRSINIVSPFYRINLKHVKIASVLYLIILIPFAIYGMVMEESYQSFRAIILSLFAPYAVNHGGLYWPIRLSSK